jgi:hypothetical protein
MVHMLHWLYTYVPSVFQMFLLFQTYVASVLFGCYICYSAHTHVLQTYVVNVYLFLDVCNMLQQMLYVASVS